nr:translation initiation factor IF-2-like [Manis javanica]
MRLREPGRSAPSSVRPRAHQDAPEGKQAKGKGLGSSGGRLARPDAGAGRVTSAAKVGGVLLPPSPTGEHLCPPARSSRARGRRARPESLRAPGRLGTTVLLRGRGSGGAQVSAAGRAFAFGQTSQARPHGPGRARPGAPGSAPGSRAPRPRSPARPLPPLPSGPLSLPASPRRRGPRKFGPGPQAGSPALTAGGGAERPALDHRAAAWAPSSHSGPCCPGRRPRWEGEEAAGESPAGAPTPPRDAAQHRPLPAAAAAARYPRGAGGARPWSPYLPGRASRPCCCRPPRDIGSGPWTDDIFF